MRVEVYFNIRTGRPSVRALEGEDKGRVILRPKSVTIQNPKFVVQPAGRKRVLKEQRKNVHAFVRGELIHANLESPELQPVTYNPYKHDSFVLRENPQKKVCNGTYAVISQDGASVIEPV